MKLSAMFDRNAPNTFGKTDNNKKHSQRVTLSPTIKVIAEIKMQRPGEQKTCHPQKNLSRNCPSNWRYAHTNADRSKTICRLPPYQGRGQHKLHN